MLHIRDRISIFSAYGHHLPSPMRLVKSSKEATVVSKLT